MAYSGLHPHRGITCDFHTPDFGVPDEKYHPNYLDIRGTEMNEKNCKHCWHWTGACYESCPPQYIMVCCHCGEEKAISEKEFLSGNKHGKYAPNSEYTIRS